jgi:hypothetical protein
MRLFVAAVLLSVLLGYLFGGRLSRLGTLRLRWWGLVVCGLAIQLVPLPEGAIGTDLVARTVVLSISYALLVAFAVLNVRIPGMALVLVGLTCNLVVIAANGGMPVSAGALRGSGQQEALDLLLAEDAAKHHLLGDGDVLTPLADVIAVPQPIGQAISIGDAFVYAGLIWVVVAAMRGRTPSSSRTEPGPYRGKHRRGASREPAAPTDLGFLPAGATRSGSAP